MKNIKLLAILTLTAFLAACADDGGGGSKGDISGAKSLAKQFENANKFSNGYLNPNSTRQVVQTMLTFGNNANQFYQMHRIGCVINGKAQLLVGERQHTAELIVGTSSNKHAQYVQVNDTDRCSIFNAQVHTPFGSKNWDWGKIPKNACQNIEANLVVKRIDKKDVKRYMGGFMYNTQHAYGNAFENDPYWNNWNRPDYSNFKEEDSYFNVYAGHRGENLRYRSTAVGDEFSKYGSDKAVFVTKNIIKNSDRECEKVIYYGRSIPRNQLLQVQFFTTQAPHK